MQNLKEMFNTGPPSSRGVKTPKTPQYEPRRIPGKTHPPVDYTTACKEHQHLKALHLAALKAEEGGWGLSPKAQASTSRVDRGDMRHTQVHTRTVVSRFGEMMEESFALPVPPQPWETEAPQLSQDSVRRHKELTSGRDYDGPPPFWRGSARFESAPSFRSRIATSKQVVAPGVPGYMGHIPHSAMGRGNHSPREEHFVKAPYKALDQTSYPKKMPPPGYAGHVHGTKSSVEAYGTSRWAPKEPQNRSPRVMVGDNYPPTTGWPMCSAGLMIEQAEGRTERLLHTARAESSALQELQVTSYKLHMYVHVHVHVHVM